MVSWIAWKRLVGLLEPAQEPAAGGWHTKDVFQEYNLALTRGLAGGRFLRWFEQAN